MLDMLAVWPEGALEPVLRAHGFHPKLIVALMDAGLVTGKIESTMVGGDPALMMRMKITPAGLSARQPTAKRRRA